MDGRDTAACSRQFMRYKECNMETSSIMQAGITRYVKPEMHIVRFSASDVVRTSGASGEGRTFCPSSNTWVEPGWSCYY